MFRHSVDSYLLSSIKLRLSMMRASLYRSPRNLKPPGDSQRESEDMAPRLSKSCCVHSYLCILYHDTIRDGILPKNNSKERPYYQQVYTRDRWYFTRSNIKRPRLYVSVRWRGPWSVRLVVHLKIPPHPLGNNTEGEK